jgi:hypothetical protein
LIHFDKWRGLRVRLRLGRHLVLIAQPILKTTS